MPLADNSRGLFFLPKEVPHIGNNPHYKTKDEYRELMTYQANLAGLFGIENAKNEPQKERRRR